MDLNLGHPIFKFVLLGSRGGPISSQNERASGAFDDGSQRQTHEALGIPLFVIV